MCLFLFVLFINFEIKQPFYIDVRLNFISKDLCVKDVINCKYVDDYAPETCLQL